MPLHVLLADDSVPAQNMGKKILADAGYCVQTVSNGLEALRKIAEHAPDIAILDIFMPGYTGLEICERLRASAATATLPVILTVGKLEPYRPEDGEHVRSNAVIVKPFAAAELVSAVRSLIGTEAPNALAEGAHLDAGPLERSAASGEALASPSAADPAATPGRAEELREGTAAEPLLSLSDATGRKTPWSPRETSVYTDAPFSSSAGATGAESLAFNPDAKATPFSASALDDLMPSTARFPAEGGASSFTEFDLELEPSPYASEPEPRRFAAEESLAAAAGMAGPEAEVVMSESAVDPENILSDLGAALSAAPESSSALDIPAFDPLLEVQEATPTMASVVSMDAVEPLEAFTPEIAAVDLDTAPDSSAEQLSQEEEARRLAFEELFNSSEALPLDDFYASPPAGETVLLPNIAESAKDHPDVFAPDFEIESSNIGRQPQFTSPELTEGKLDEAEPMSAFEMIPERDPLLEDPLGEANLPGIEDVPQAAITAAAQIIEIEPLEVEATPAPVEAVAEPVEVQQIVLETASSETPQGAAYSVPELQPVLPEPEIAAAAQIIEIEPLDVEATPEQFEAIPEPEVQQIDLETAPSKTQQEAVYSVPESQPALPEPEITAAAQIIEIEPLEVEAVPEQAEAVHEPEEVQQVVLDTAPSETQQESVYSIPELQAALPEPEITAAAQIIEIEPLEAEAVPEQAEAVPELAEVQQVVLDTAPSETQQESVYSIPELQAALPEPEITAAAQIIEIEPLEVEAVPEQAEAVPELAEVQQVVLETAPSETQQEAVYSVPELQPRLPEPEIAATAQAAEVQPQEFATAPEPAEVPQIIPEAASVLSEPELVHPEPEMHVAETASPELSLGPDDAERVSQAVDRVFNRFKRLLVAAIVRELGRPD